MIDRKLVYKKYDGKCAYCGLSITEKEMQVDHIIPKARGGNDDFENLNPSCRLCNHYKRDMELDFWRNKWLGGIIERLRKIYIVRVAERYKIITFNEWDKKFYFERWKNVR